MIRTIVNIYRTAIRCLATLAIGLMFGPTLFAGTATYTYDDVGRLQQITYSDGTVTTYSLDAAGNRTNLTNALDTIPPTQPTGLSGTVSTSPFNVALSWTASVDPRAGIAGYYIYRNSTQIGSASTAPYTDTTMACTTAYSYTVAAYDNAVPPNVSTQSLAWAVTTPSIPPTAPTGLTKVSATSLQVVISWTASSDACASISGYKVYRGGTQIGTVTGTSYTDGTTSGTTTYSYTVAAYDAKGNSSAQSSPLGVTTPDTIPPSVPASLTAADLNAVQINLAWTASTDTGGSGLAGYKIYRGGTLIGTSATASYSDTTCAANTKYSYTVAAYDNAGNVSAVSNTASATTNAIPSVPGKPGPAGIIKTSPWSEVWTASQGPVSYYNFSSNGVIHKVTAPTTSYSITGGNGLSYTVQAQACNSSNQCSAYGATSVVTYCAGVCP